MDSYNGKNLVRYLGSVSSAVGVMLFFLGAAGVLVSVIAVTMGFAWQVEDKSFLAIPIWSLWAVPLGLAMRRRDPSFILSIFASLWLALGFGAMLLTNYLG